MRKKLVAGNWKMNTSLEEAINLLIDYNNYLEDEKVIVCVPFTHIATAVELANDNIAIGAQNVSEFEKGAYTGEISAEMLASVSVGFCIVGHSERRKYFHETDDVISKKITQLLKNEIQPIFCCGEILEIREKHQHNEFVASQIENTLFHLSEKQIENVIIAYEPVWAIGSGHTATPEQAQSMHQNIRNILAKKYGQTLAQKITILYGGSVNAENAASLFAEVDIDGALVGGASLNPVSFTDIIQSL
jgi:triosephosphate isomerase (TIM)